MAQQVDLARRSPLYPSLLSFDAYKKQCLSYDLLQRGSSHSERRQGLDDTQIAMAINAYLSLLSFSAGAYSRWRAMAASDREGCHKRDKKHPRRYDDL